MRDLRTPQGLARNQIWFGEGRCPGHFGELLQGAFAREDGRRVRALVTMPCGGVQASAHVEVAVGSGVIEAPPGCAKSRNALERYLELHALPRRLDFSLKLESAIPVGVGMGSSTSDVVATIRALDSVFGLRTPAEQIAGLCLASEAASDSVMFDRRAVLFAQREGVVVEDFGVAFPSLALLGLDLAPGKVFDTDRTPPARYSEAEIRRFDALRRVLRTAFADGDLHALCAVATESAEINQRFFPKPRFAELLALARAERALGVCVSHSGTIAGLLYPPQEGRALEAASAAARRAGFTLTGVHHVG